MFGKWKAGHFGGVGSVIIKPFIECSHGLSYVLHLTHLTLEKVDDIRTAVPEISVDFHAKV